MAKKSAKPSHRSTDEWEELYGNYEMHTGAANPKSSGYNAPPKPNTVFFIRDEKDGFIYKWFKPKTGKAFIVSAVTLTWCTRRKEYFPHEGYSF